MASKLSVNRGTTYAITFNYQKDGVAASLVGASVFFTVKTTEFDGDTSDTTAVLSKTVTSHTDAAGGITTITINPADTATLTPATYFYDIKVKESTGAIYKCDEGKLVLDGSPTNRMS